jgi:hypothetical protein
MADQDKTGYIENVAQQLGLGLPPEELARVKLVFGNLERAAAHLRDTPIADDIVAAAVFSPGPGGDNG